MTTPFPTSPTRSYEYNVTIRLPEVGFRALRVAYTPGQAPDYDEFEILSGVDSSGEVERALTPEEIEALASDDLASDRIFEAIYLLLASWEG